MTIEWISEGTKLPRIGQTVLLLTPRQAGEFWDLHIACLLARHEGVTPRPVSAGGPWPTDYYWGNPKVAQDTRLITGNGWWASVAGIPLPPQALHAHEAGFDFIRQVGIAFVPKKKAD